MNRTFFTPFIILLIALAFVLPALVSAADYIPLAPLPNTTVGGGPTATLESYLPGVFKLLIAVAGGLAALVMVIGGVQYLSTDAISGKEDGRERMTNALIGLILAIASWLILNTINPNTLKFDLSLQRIPPPTTTTAPTGTGAGDVGSATACTKSTNPSCYTYYPNGSAWQSDSSVRSQLDRAISVTGTGTDQPCSTVSQPGCTSLFGLPSRAVSGLNALANACSNCIITVTGGTEFWSHVSHGPGFARVDLSYGNTSDTIYRFLQNTSLSGATSAGTDNSCVKGYSAWNFRGAIYVLEGGHWHVCY